MRPGFEYSQALARESPAQARAFRPSPAHTSLLCRRGIVAGPADVRVAVAGFEKAKERLVALVETGYDGVQAVPVVETGLVRVSWTSVR